MRGVGRTHHERTRISVDSSALTLKDHKGPKDKGPKDKGPKDKGPKDKSPKDKSPKDLTPSQRSPPPPEERSP